MSGRTKSATRPTRAEAVQAGAELTLALGGTPSRSTGTVADLIAGHLADVEDQWSPTTLDDAKRVTRKLPTEFGARRVSDVTPAVIAGLYRQLRADGWSPHRLRRLRMVLNGAWKLAISYEWATSNPCRDVKIPKIDKPEISPSTDDEVRAVLDHADGAVQMFVRLAAVTGCRRGEIVAFQWGDIDLDRAEIAINRSLVQVPGQPPVARPTKTGSKAFRVLALDLPTVALLRRYRAHQTELAVANGLPSPVWLFSHDAGVTPWRPDYITRAVKIARERAGVDGVTIKNLRHYVAISMLQDGESAADAAGQLGHASVATTLTTYWRWMPGRNRAATDRRAARFGGA